MKYAYAVLLFLWVLTARGQITYNFESGSDTLWYQSTEGHWEVSSEQPIHGSFSLHHTYDNPNAGHDQVSIPICGLSQDSDTIIWTFFVQHTYNPSSANNWAVFLTSDRDASEMYPNSNASSIIIGVNFTGSDDLLALWKSENGVTMEIFSTQLNWQESIGTSACGIKVIRTNTGNWEILINPSADGQTWNNAGNFYFDGDLYPEYFGIYYEYSSAQDRKLWFDDLSIEGTFIPDTTSPKIISYRIPEPDQVAVMFSEPVKMTENGLAATATVLPGNLNEQNISTPSPDSIIITLNGSLIPDKAYQITLAHITDLSGNVLTSNTIQILYHKAQRFDIQINEIFPDPTPPLGLPEYEYIELFNRSMYDLWMEGWTLTLDTKKVVLPTFHVKQGDYIILCNSTDIETFADYGNTLAITGMPALKNDGMSLTLRDNNGIIIHHIHYASSWYRDETKSSGGWSLEQIDPENPCPREENWTSCMRYPGGTPGKQNSVLNENPDIIPPTVANLFIKQDSILELRFSEPYDTVPASSPANFEVDHHVGKPGSIICFPPDYFLLDLHFPHPFEKNTMYTLSLNQEFSDCSGNHLQAPLAYSFSTTVPPDSNDVVINEILFNPLPGGCDYVEVFNRSSHTLDLRSLLLAGKDPDNGKPTDVKKITDDPRMCFPGSYFLMTTDPEIILARYPQNNPKAFVALPSMPSMPDKSGNILLLDTCGKVVDAVTYSEKMQFALISDPEGVALERIFPDVPSQEWNNWHSASSESGYGTPGLPNSQSVSSEKMKKEIFLEPEIFSPDNDGYHDFLSIHYSFTDAGNMARILIFNARGQLVKTLRNNQLLSRQGIITWDGLNDHGKKPPTGIYVVYIEVYTPGGTTSRYKKACVLAGSR